LNISVTVPITVEPYFNAIWQPVMQNNMQITAIRLFLSF